MKKLFALALFFLFISACTEKKVDVPSPQNSFIKEAEVLKKIQILGIQYQSLLEKNAESALISDLRCRLNLAQSDQATTEVELKKMVNPENLKTLSTWALSGPAEKLTELQIKQMLDPKLSESKEVYEEMKNLKTQIEKLNPLSVQDQKPGDCY